MRGRPEAILQKKIQEYLKGRDWGVKPTTGNLYQSGFPDLYCYHLRYGTRWIEVKVKDKYKFTPAQMETFPEFSSKGVGIWILVDNTEREYKKLFKPANWHTYLQMWK